LNPTLADDLQVLDKYRTRKTPDKYKKKKSPAKNRTKPSQTIRIVAKNDFDECNVIHETPPKKVRRRIHQVRDESSSDDDFENFIQKEKESQKLASQSWEAYGLGNQGTHAESSQRRSLTVPSQNAETCGISRQGESLLGSGGLKLPKKLRDDTENDPRKKKSDSQPSGLNETETKEKDFQKPTSTVLQSSRRLSSQFVSPCVIPDSVEHDVNNKGVDATPSTCSRRKDRVSQISRQMVLESVSSSAETQEPIESVATVQSKSDIFTRAVTENSSTPYCRMTENVIDEPGDRKKSPKACGNGKCIDRIVAESIGGQMLENSCEMQIENYTIRKSPKGGVKRKSYDDQILTDGPPQTMGDHTLDEENGHDVSYSNDEGHVPKKMRPTTLELSPVVYKHYDDSSQYLLKSSSTVQSVKKNIKSGPELSCAGDVDVSEKKHDYGMVELSPSRFALDKMNPKDSECSPLATCKFEMKRLAAQSCVENSTKKLSPKGRLSGECESRTSVVELKVEETVKTPRHTSVNMKQKLHSPLSSSRSEYVTLKTVKQSPSNMADKENLLKRKVEMNGGGMDETDGQRKRVANTSAERHRSPAPMKIIEEGKVRNHEGSAVSLAVSSPLMARAPLPMRRGRSFVVSGFDQSMKVRIVKCFHFFRVVL
jgi:hypothetical protein